MPCLLTCTTAEPSIWWQVACSKHTGKQITNGLRSCESGAVLLCAQCPAKMQLLAVCSECHRTSLPGAVCDRAQLEVTVSKVAGTDLLL